MSKETREKERDRERAAQVEIETDAACALGVNGVYERRRKLEGMVGAVGQEIAKKYCEEEERLGEEEAARLNDERRRVAQEQHWVAPAPLWMQVSGLYPNAHREMGPNERAGCVRKLLRRVERMVRFDLRSRKDAKAQRTDGATVGRGRCSRQEGQDAGETSVIEETVFWSPVRTICEYLEISLRGISGLCKEITGLSIEQIVDRIRAERLKASFKERLKGWVLEWFSKNENRKAVEGKSREEIADAIFSGVKMSRRSERFHRTTWAMGLGFSSYPRLFRAVLLAEGVTPFQLEIGVIEELLGDSLCVGGQNQGSETEMGGTGDGGKQIGADGRQEMGKPAEAG